MGPGIKLSAALCSAEVVIKNLQNMHEKSESLPPTGTGARRRMELAS